MHDVIRAKGGFKSSDGVLSTYNERFKKDSRRQDAAKGMGGSIWEELTLCLKLEILSLKNLKKPSQRTSEARGIVVIGKAPKTLLLCKWTAKTCKMFSVFNWKQYCVNGPLDPRLCLLTPNVTNWMTRYGSRRSSFNYSSPGRAFSWWPHLCVFGLGFLNPLPRQHTLYRSGLN